MLQLGRAWPWSAWRLFAWPARPASGVAGWWSRTTSSADLGWDAVALGHDGSSLGRRDGLPIDVAELVGLSAAQARDDAGEQDRRDGAQGGGVVAGGVGHQPLVAGGQGGIDLAGVVSGHEQRLAQAGVALLGRATVVVGGT